MSSRTCRGRRPRTASRSPGSTSGARRRAPGPAATASPAQSCRWGTWGYHVKVFVYGALGECYGGTGRPCICGSVQPQTKVSHNTGCSRHQQMQAPYVNLNSGKVSHLYPRLFSSCRYCSSWQSTRYSIVFIICGTVAAGSMQYSERRAWDARHRREEGQRGSQLQTACALHAASCHRACHRWGAAWEAYSCQSAAVAGLWAESEQPV